MDKQAQIMTAPLPANEAERLQALHRYAILDTPPEVAFDRITRLAARLFDVPIVMVSLVDQDRQWFKSCYGLDVRQTDREISFCAHAILADDVFIVPDATRDETFKGNILVTGDVGLRFYAGAPLKTQDGHSLGSLCLIDTRPRLFGDAEAAQLRDLAAIVVDEMELRSVGQQMRDEVSERREAEAALQSAQRELEAASRAKSEFLSRMSHELRTPMNAILGFGQLLEMDELESEQQESVGHILKAGRHLLTLINEVLDIARIEADRLSLSLEPVLLHDVAHEVCDILGGLALERRIELVIALGAHERQHVLADRQRLKQVLLNLAANAIKYNREGGRVELACELSPQEAAKEPGVGAALDHFPWVRLLVRDTGPGLSREQCERLFVPFERIGMDLPVDQGDQASHPDAEPRLAVEGTGLGLTISKRLTEAMGGRIGLDSVPGQGSVFWVELPLAEGLGEHGGALDDPEAPGEAPQQQTRAVVLYIEDNLSNLSLVQRMMQRRPGIRLLPAMQGQRGLELAREHQPHLILLDLHLPDINGDEVLRQLRASPATRDIPVILISADATLGQAERMLRAGAREYLTKPLDVANFLRAIDSCLREGHGESEGRESIEETRGREGTPRNC